MDVKSIQCKSCAAPLSLYGGGHRIRTLSCEYCGAVMDVREDYKILDKFANQDKPTCPLDIGMQGEIKSIPFIIVGMIGYRSHYGDRWVDLSLFSETHGYAWLSYQLGHFSFARRVRDLPDRDMSQLGTHSKLRVKGTTYSFFEAYQAEITYVAGELTWVAKLGDKSIHRDAIAPPMMFSMEETEDEREFYLSEYIDPSVIKSSFSFDSDSNFDTHRSSLHPGQPFIAPLRETVSKVSRIPLALSLLFIFVFSFIGEGKTVFTQNISDFSTGLTVVRNFKIDNPNHLVEVRFNNAYGNRWIINDITLFDEQSEVFSFGSKLSSNNSSSVQTQTGKARFQVKNSGNYSLRMKVDKGINYSSPNSGQAIKLSVRQGVIGNRYFKYLLILSLIGFLTFYISRHFFEKKRWSLTD